MVNDGDNSSNTQTRDIAVSSVNDTPYVAAPLSSYSINEQSHLTIHGTGFSLIDVDASSGLLTATLSVGEGTLTVDEGDSGIAISGSNAGGTVEFSGTLTQIDSLLRGVGGGTIVYSNSSDAPSASTTLFVIVNDNGNTGSDPGYTADAISEEATASQTINIIGINDRPTLSDIEPQVVNEDVKALVQGIIIADADSNGTDISVQLQVSNGVLSLERGEGVEILNGANNSSELTLSGTPDEINATLSSLTYQGAPDFNGQDSLLIVVRDAQQLQTQTQVPITVNPVNDAANGIPLISGDSIANALLTADVSKIEDADGLGTFQYQWFRGDVPIAGAIQSAYRLVNADIGSLISVEVNFLDSDGFLETWKSFFQSEPVLAASNPELDVISIEATALSEELVIVSQMNVSSMSVESAQEQAALVGSEERLIQSEDISDIPIFTLHDLSEKSEQEAQVNYDVEVLLSQMNSAAVPNAYTTEELHSTSIQIARLDPISELPEILSITNSQSTGFKDKVEEENIRETQRAIDKIDDSDRFNLGVRENIYTGLGISIAVFLFQWAISAGALLITAISALPVWKFFDPMPIFVPDSTDKPKAINDKEADPMSVNDMSSRALADNSDSSIERIFEDRKTRRPRR